MFTACLLLLLPATAFALPEPSNEAFDRAGFEAAATRMREDAGAPGMAVAVLRDGQTLYAGGFGIAGPDEEPVTPETAFRIGSITKSFCALVLLQLASEGKLDLDDPAVRHLPNFRTSSKSTSDRITIDHLVTHRSGLSTLEGNRFGKGEPGRKNPAAAVADLVDVQLFAEPGFAFQYSNANYVILSHLIEVLDGRPFERALEARIFEPLGMRNSFVETPPSEAITVATGYRLWFGIPISWRPGEGGEEPDRRLIGAGGISSSVEDIARYLEAIRIRDPRVVPEDADRLFAVNPFFEHWGYGWGWYTNSSGDVPVFEHSGFTPGFFALASIVPAEDAVVVVLTNMSGLAHGDLPRAVTHAALGREPVAAAAPIGAKAAIWSAVAAPLGLLLLLFKTGRSLRRPGHQPMRRRTRVLNVLAALGLTAGAFTAYVGFQRLVGVSFSTGASFFPDLTATVVAAMAISLLIAAGRMALAVRGR